MRFTLPLLALAALAAPAAAQSGEATVTVRIALADIDLSSERDRAVLEQRIESQIKKTCVIETSPRYGYGRDLVDTSCVANARAEALAKLERIAASEARQGGEVAAN